MKTLSTLSKARLPMIKRILQHFLFTLVVGLIVAPMQDTFAQTSTASTSSTSGTTPWPTRPVTIVVPFAVGGGTDIGTRILAQKLSQLWGQSVVIDNKGGAGGNVGLEVVARAKPDGFTLLTGNVGTQSIRSEERRVGKECA